ncbi:MAG: glycosyltransferase family 2 protein [bacterium]
MLKDRLYIVIPAYNEEMNIESVAKEWHEVVAKIGNNSKVAIIDDGSNDHTYKKLLALQKQLPCLVTITKSNSGHGATILYGYHYAIKNNADYVFQTDGDGQTLPSEFASFWEDRTKYSAIIGHRNRRQDGLSRSFVTKTLKLVLFLIFGLNVVDANTPFRLVKTRVLKKYIEKIPKDFNLSNVMLTVLLVKNKENIDFRPITFRPRQGGVNSINLTRIFKIGLKAVKDFSAIKKSLDV